MLYYFYLKWGDTLTTGERIKLCRKRLSLSAEKLASIVGVSPATVYRWEKGDIEKVPGYILEPLADALQTTPAYLAGWGDDQDNPVPGDESPAMVPKTLEARIVSFGMDSLPKEEREKILAILQTMYSNKPDLFKEDTAHDA